MNIFEILKQDIDKAVFHLYGIEQKNISIELPSDSKHGDLSTNAAMVLAKILKKSPIDIAHSIAIELKLLHYIENISIAGAGFINFHLKIACWHNILTDIMNLNIKFGDNNLGNNEPINIEFLSTNPTGPMHIGHSRCAIYGDSLANLMRKCGYKVTKEFYINDAGTQIDTLAKSVYIRYLEATGEIIESIPAGLYPGEYLIPVAKNLFQIYGHKLKEMDKKDRTEIIKEFAVESMMKLIKKDIELLGIDYNVYFSEKTLHEAKKIDQIVCDLQNRGVVYKGIPSPPKGKSTEDWEPREQLLLKSTDFGDDVDRSLQKANGDWTYAAADIAYMQNKLERGFNKITMVLGSDHQGYKKRMQAAAHALAGNKIDFEMKFCQLVNFLQNGQPYKMSKRKGTFITIEDVLEEVDKDIIRFVMLTRRNDQVLDFDLEKVKEQSKDNPVFYVQYANARINSSLNNAIKYNKDYETAIENKSYNLSLLKRQEEINLIKKMSSWPKIIEQSCIHQEPHRVVFYLIELASEFHAFWSKGNEDESLKIIDHKNFDLTLARLILAKSVSIVIASGLDIFNIKPINSM